MNGLDSLILRLFFPSFAQIFLLYFPHASVYISTRPVSSFNPLSLLSLIPLRQPCTS